MKSYEETLVLDMACGSRMFWFDRQNPEVLFCDNRRETHSLSDISSAGGSRSLVIDPDMQVDFTELPFPSNRYALVVFDPPHLLRNGRKSWLAKKYGKLGGDWRDDLRKGFTEGFRVLRPEGVLIFKWNEHEIPVSQVLALTPEKPLFGNRCGKTAKSHWIVFMKPRNRNKAWKLAEDICNRLWNELTPNHASSVKEIAGVLNESGGGRFCFECADHDRCASAETCYAHHEFALPKESLPLG